jgi:hypothetical protein
LLFQILVPILLVVLTMAVTVMPESPTFTEDPPSPPDYLHQVILEFPNMTGMEKVSPRFLIPPVICLKYTLITRKQG